MNHNDNQWFLTKVKRAIADYRMAQTGDRIAVGLSGGKDSLFLLYVLALLRSYSHLKFELAAIHLAVAGGPENRELAGFCRQLAIPYFEETTEIAEIVFERRQEKNPCALCSKMRRGALVETARKYGFQKIALGHHGDDAVETLLLNSLLGRKLNSFSPVIVYPDTNITIIRPLIYLRERTVASVAKREKLPVQPSTCPLDKKTRRQEMKELLAEIETKVPRSGDSLLGGLKDGWLKEKETKLMG